MKLSHQSGIWSKIAEVDTRHAIFHVVARNISPDHEMTWWIRQTFPSILSFLGSLLSIIDQIYRLHKNREIVTSLNMLKGVLPLTKN